MSDPTLETDDKDWTWVLDQRCPECGFVATDIARSDVGDMVRRTARSFAAELAEPDAAERSRPDRCRRSSTAPTSATCTGCTARRLGLMLAEVDPLYPNCDQDATSVTDDDGSQDPVAVADAVVATGDDLADAFDAVTDEQWLRTGRRSDGASFTVDTFARYLVHDPVHHLWDVGGSLG